MRRNHHDGQATDNKGIYHDYHCGYHYGHWGIRF